MVEVLTVTDLQERRERLLDSLGVDEADLRARAAEYALSARELAVLDELEGLDYLLEDA